MRLKKDNCNRKFCFGEKVYKSEREITMPVAIKSENGDHIKKMITISIIDREEDLFLCGLKKLKQWRAAVFYESNKMMFIETNKKVYRYGHQLVKFQLLEKWSQ